MELVVQDNMKIGSYTAKWLDVFLTQIDLPAVRQALIALYKDNDELTHEVNESILSLFFEVISEEGGYDNV